MKHVPAKVRNQELNEREMTDIYVKQISTKIDNN